MKRNYIKNRHLHSKLLLLILLFLIPQLQGFSGEKKNFLWQVDSDKTTVFLLGSVHIAKETLYPLDTIIEESFEKSDILVVEANINDMDPGLFMEKAVYKDGSTLESVLTKKNYDTLAALFKKFGIDKLVYNKLKPWVATMMLFSTSSAPFITSR